MWNFRKVRISIFIIVKFENGNTAVFERSVFVNLKVTYTKQSWIKR
jgi:hypothetical protein